MGDDNPPMRYDRISLAQCGSDVIVGKPVETVSPDPSVMQFTGQREALGHRRLVMMKGGIEARDLRQRWRHSRDGADCREVVRLVQRRERTQRLQMVQHRVI